jgi:hypothetical protein
MALQLDQERPDELGEQVASLVMDGLRPRSARRARR